MHYSAVLILLNEMRGIFWKTVVCNTHNSVYLEHDPVLIWKINYF